MCSSLLALALLAAIAPPTDAPPADNGHPAEVLPQPAVELPSPALVNPVYLRTSRYDVWQYYAVDRQGMFRPRVIYSPFGAYYLYNGQPFPWTVTHQLEFGQMLYADP